MSVTAQVAQGSVDVMEADLLGGHSSHVYRRPLRLMSLMKLDLGKPTGFSHVHVSKERRTCYELDLLSVC